MATTLGNFLSGAGVPSNGDGSDGDHYRNTSNQDLWFKSGGTWEVVGNLRDDAPDGIGTTIQHGAGNPLNVNGEDGFYYRDTLNQNLWFKVEGIWHLLCRLGAPDQGDGGGAADCTLTVTQLTLPEDYTYEGTNTPYPIEPAGSDGQILEIDLTYDDAFLVFPSNVATDVSFILRFTTSSEDVSHLTLKLDSPSIDVLHVRAADLPYTNFKVFLSTLGEASVEIIELGRPRVWEVIAVDGATYPEALSDRHDNAGIISVNTGDLISETFNVVTTAVSSRFRDNIRIHITGEVGYINQLTVGGAVAPRPVYPGDILRVVSDPIWGTSNFNTRLIVERTSYVEPPAATILVSTANTTVVVDASHFTYPGGFMWNTTSSSPVTVEFPTPLSLGMTTLGQSRQISIRQGGTGVVTATGTGGAVLEGAAVFTQQYEVKTFMSKDLNTWIVVGAQ